jgi:hypothetical protein
MCLDPGKDVFKSGQGCRRVPARVPVGLGWPPKF